MEQPEPLLACPFCGQEAMWLTDIQTRGKWFIACKCGIELTTANHDREFQAKHWNRRAGGSGASNDNRGERLAPASWLEEAGSEHGLKQSLYERILLISPWAEHCSVFAYCVRDVARKIGGDYETALFRVLDTVNEAASGAASSNVLMSRREQ